MAGRKKINPKQTADSQNVSAVLIDSENLVGESKTTLTTKEELDRSSPPVIEKAKESEKDTAPTIILTWFDSSGKRITRTYTCAQLKIDEYTSETLTKSGKKTIVNLNLEASIIERDSR